MRITAHKASEQEKALREPGAPRRAEERRRNDALAKQRTKMATELR